MVKHIVCWKLNDAGKAHQEALFSDLSARFHALPGVVDGLTAIEVGQNYNGGEFDLVLLCEFTTREAEKAYQTHPAHVAVKEIVQQNVRGRVAVDYEL